MVEPDIFNRSGNFVLTTIRFSVRIRDFTKNFFFIESRRKIDEINSICANDF